MEEVDIAKLEEEAVHLEKDLIVKERETLDVLKELEKTKMSIEEMILDYTINGAKQLGIEDKKGSVEAGKDADFLVFDKDLLTAAHEGFSCSKPAEVYFGGKKM